MINSENRFRGSGSLKFVYTRGKTVRGPYFSTKSIYNDRQEAFRATVVVSRKVNKSAVVRNKIRRRIYEAIRKYSERIIEPYDIVVTVFHDSVLELTPKELHSQVKRQLSSSGVLTKAK